MYRNNQLVDTLLEITPITADSLEFMTVYDDSAKMSAQKKIFMLPRFKRTIIKNNFFDFWFTTLIDKSDSTKDYGLFYVRKKDNAALENWRIRLDGNNEIIGVNSNPFLFDNFTPIDAWSADTILRDE